MCASQRMPWLSLLALLAPAIWAAQHVDSTTTVESGSVLVLSGTISTPISEATLPTGTYETYSSTVTLSTDSTGGVYTVGNGTGTHTASTTGTASGNSTGTTGPTTTSQSITVLSGGVGGSSLAANATRTGAPASSSSPVVNTRPCNGYPEFCNRNYSNITMVAAHNSPFVRPGNAAANQDLPVLTQLNDGIRMRTCC